MKGSQKVIDYLNKALRHELTAVSQYWVHYRLLEDWGFRKYAQKEREESIEEMHHADKLIERIIFLDGHPNLQTLDPLLIGQKSKRSWKATLRPNIAPGRSIWRRAPAAGRRKIMSPCCCSNSSQGRGRPYQFHRNRAQALREDRSGELRPVAGELRRQEGIGYCRDCGSGLVCRAAVVIEPTAVHCRHGVPLPLPRHSRHCLRARKPFRRAFSPRETLASRRASDASTSPPRNFQARSLGGEPSDTVLELCAGLLPLMRVKRGEPLRVRLGNHSQRAHVHPLARHSRAQRHGWRALRHAEARLSQVRLSPTSSRRPMPAHSSSIRIATKPTRSAADLPAC